MWHLGHLWDTESRSETAQNEQQVRTSRDVGHISKAQWIHTSKNGGQRIHHKFQVDRSNIMNISSQHRTAEPGRHSWIFKWHKKNGQYIQERLTQAENGLFRCMLQAKAWESTRQKHSETLKWTCPGSKGISQTSQHKQQWSLNLRASRGGKRYVKCSCDMLRYVVICCDRRM